MQNFILPVNLLTSTDYINFHILMLLNFKTIYLYFGGNFPPFKITNKKRAFAYCAVFNRF